MTEICPGSCSSLGKGKHRPLKTCTDRHSTMWPLKQGKTLMLTASPFPPGTLWYMVQGLSHSWLVCLWSGNIFKPQFLHLENGVVIPAPHRLLWRLCVQSPLHRSWQSEYSINVGFLTSTKQGSLNICPWTSQLLFSLVCLTLHKPAQLFQTSVTKSISYTYGPR